LNTHNGRAWFARAIGLSRYSALFAAIYKILPEKPIFWRDIDVAAVATAPLSRQASP
jgi:hypothetical protein